MRIYKKNWVLIKLEHLLNNIFSIILLMKITLSRKSTATPGTAPRRAALTRRIEQCSSVENNGGESTTIVAMIFLLWWSLASADVLWCGQTQRDATRLFDFVHLNNLFITSAYY